MMITILFRGPAGLRQAPLAEDGMSLPYNGNHNIPK
jgi:hypothetical protein